MGYDRLPVGSSNEIGGHHVILLERDSGRAFSVAPCDSVMIELEELPVSGQRWHVADSPPGFSVIEDGWLRDHTFTKKGTRRAAHRGDLVTRRILLNVDYGAEAGEIALVFGPEQAAYDEWGLAQLDEREIDDRWSVFIDEVDLETPLSSQRDLPGRRKGEPQVHELPLVIGARGRLSGLAGDVAHSRTTQLI